MATVQDILDRKGKKIVTGVPRETVLEAARRMQAERIGALLRTWWQSGDAGIFTERDILQRVVAQGRDPASAEGRGGDEQPGSCCKRRPPWRSAGTP